MQTSPLCKLLNIEVPVIQAGVPWVSNAELAAAISNAGGLGVIMPDAGGRAGGSQVENLGAQIRRARALTGSPFGVTVFLRNPEARELMERAVEEGVRVIITAGPGPAVHTEHLKQRGAAVLHIVASVRHAMAAEAAGVDAIIAAGVETGGLLGADETPSMVLTPQVVDAVEVPVVASGGVATGRGLAAVMALGAQGACVGTRFIATHECIAHTAYKEAILSAVDRSTLVLGRGVMPMRALKTPFTLQLYHQGVVAAGDARAFWDAELRPERVRAAALEGDMEQGIPLAGATAGLVSDIVAAGEAMARIVEEARSALARL